MTVVLGVFGQFNFIPDAKHNLQIVRAIYGLGIVITGIQVFVTQILIPYLYRKNDNSKIKTSKLSPQGAFFCCLPIFFVIYCVTLRVPQFILQLESTNVSQSFESTMIIIKKDSQKSRYAHWYTLDLEADNIPIYSIVVPEANYNQAMVGASLHIYGQRSEFGTLIERWVFSK
ncbi:MAG: hypothetical protein NVSMB40_08960 [Aquirhabdus sp.]